MKFKFPFLAVFRVGTVDILASRLAASPQVGRDALLSLGAAGYCPYRTFLIFMLMILILAGCERKDQPREVDIYAAGEEIIVLGASSAEANGIYRWRGFLEYTNSNGKYSICCMAATSTNSDGSIKYSSGNWLLERK